MMKKIFYVRGKNLKALINQIGLIVGNPYAVENVISDKQYKVVVNSEETMVWIYTI